MPTLANGLPDGAHAVLLAATLKAELLADGDRVKLDGVLGEWPARTRADTFVVGAADPSFGFTMGVRYDATSIYVGGEVTTASFRRTARFADDEDHASLILAFGTGVASVAAYEVSFFAGKPGESTGKVRFASGGQGAVPGARIVEAPMTGGYSFEAVIPWSAFPEARTVRVGLRGVGRYYEHSGTAGARIAATGPGDARHVEGLPPLPTDPEQALDEGFLTEHGLRGQAPSVDLLADVSGDAMKERIQVWGNVLTVCGPGYQGGKGYFFRDLGAPLVRLEARPLTGRGKDDLVVVRRMSEGALTRDWFEVLSFLQHEQPTRTFGQEIAVTRGATHVDDTVHTSPSEIDVSTLTPHGWDAATYHEPVAVDVSPILLPWGAVKSQTFRFDGTSFTKVNEVAQTPTGVSVPAASVPRLPQDPAAVRASIPSTSPPSFETATLLDQYRHDHALSSAAAVRSSVDADLDGDGHAEHVALIGRDLVVTGPSLGGGHAYSFVTLDAFTAEGDVHEVTASDLAGHGSAHLLVRGTRHIAASGETIDEDVLYVYALRGNGLVRVFAIETARAVGAKRVQGLVQFIPARSGHGKDLDVRPGRATGWTSASYPWPQDRPGQGSTEPLLLPWGGVPNVRYAWDGSRFAVQ